MVNFSKLSADGRHRSTRLGFLSRNERYTMKIFGLGLSKTGTTSLTKALCMLGYRVEHNGAMFVTEPPEQLTHLDGATDELGAAYAALDQQYPGSKFILTVRDVEPWLKSCQHHFRNPIDPDTRVGRLLTTIYGTTVFEADKFADGYRRHVQQVQDYFRGREGVLLVLDVSHGEVWPKLCQFLEKPVPSEPFPRENVSRSLSRVSRRIKGFFRPRGGSAGA